MMDKERIAQDRSMAIAESFFRRRFLSVLVLVAFITFQSAVLGKVDVNVTRVGFPSLSGDDVIRAGQWTPVVVDLALLDEPAFDGRVRVGQLDLDGDEVFDSVEVHLNAEQGGTRRVLLLTLPNPVGSQGRFYVELHTMEGEAVPMVSQGEVTRRAKPAKQPVVIPDDDQVLLSVANGTVGRLADLVDLEQNDAYRRPVRVAHISPAELPDHWIGLESIDIIRWENANPSELSERQIQALLDWVEQGGRLLIMASPADGSFGSRKRLDAAMPVQLGDLITLATIGAMHERMMRRTSDEPPHPGFQPPATAIRCKARPSAVVLARDDAESSDLITQRALGRGTVIFCGITERNLFKAGGNAAEFYRILFQLSPIQANEQIPARDVSLFGFVSSAIAFTVSGGLYLGLAALFSLVYVSAATIGSWVFLNARGWRNHHWTAFALIAAAASTASVLGVNSIRGFGERLHQVSIIDAEGGEAFGYATTFFGYKTGSDRVLDLWMPADSLSASEPQATPCFLRPLPEGTGIEDRHAGYADPQEYRLLPANAAIKGVRIRGTLKQFEGRWQGRLPGKIQASIAIRFNGALYDWRMTEDSYIVNDLGFTLHDCYLLQARYDSLAPVDRDERLEKSALRDDDIHAFYIGNLEADGKKFYPSARCYLPEPGQPEFRPLFDAKLSDAQKQWNRPFRRTFEQAGSEKERPLTFTFGEQQNALLLMSTIGEYDSTKSATTTMAQFVGVRTWSRDRLRQLDLRERLQRDCVYLIGFARDPGPVRLFRRQGERPFAALEPEKESSWTMYRIRIPVTLIDPSNASKGGGP